MKPLEYHSGFGNVTDILLSRFPLDFTSTLTIAVLPSILYLSFWPFDVLDVFIGCKDTKK